MVTKEEQIVPNPNPTKTKKSNPNATSKKSLPPGVPNPSATKTTTKKSFLPDTSEAPQGALLPLNYFENRVSQLQNTVEEGLKKVKNESDLDKEKLVVKDFFHNDYEIVSKKMNELFNNKSNEKHKNHQKNMQELNDSKGESIKQLNKKVDNMVDSSPELKEKLKLFNDRRQQCEQKVKKARNDATGSNNNLMRIEDFETINEHEIKLSMKYISKKIDELSKNLESKQEETKGAIGQLKIMYEMGLHGVISKLMVRFDDALEHIEYSYREKEEKLKEAYEEQEEMLNKMVKELTEMNKKLEKKRELEKEIHNIYHANPSDPSLRTLITDNVSELKAINKLSDRRSRVESLYKKFIIFSNLLDREDLGVKAKASDIEAIKLWLDRTNINAVLCHFGKFTILSADDIHRAFHGKHFRIAPATIGGQPNGIENFFKGSDIGKPLMKKRKHIENKIKSIKRPDRNVVMSQLADIFTKNAADDYVVVNWTHPYRSGGVCHGLPFASHQITYIKNGKQLGFLFQETLVDWWGELNGIFGHIPYRKNWGPSGAFDWVGGWRNTGKNRFQKDYNATIDAIKNRAMALFDFETNPDLPLQRFYKNAGVKDPEVLTFPSKEIEILIKQCNEFLKLTA